MLRYRVRHTDGAGVVAMDNDSLNRMACEKASRIIFFVVAYPRVKKNVLIISSRFEILLKTVTLSKRSINR
jgi:hypothetical protein